MQPDSMGHRARFSDSSIYDFVCIDCGATDCPWDDKLSQPCPKANKSEEDSNV